MICSILKKMFNDRESSVVIVRNAKGDLLQIKKRILETLNYLKEYLLDNGFDINISNLIINNKVKQSVFKKAFDGKNPKIFILLGNNSQLGIFFNMLSKLKLLEDIKKERNREYPFSLFIDEADIMDSGLSLRYKILYKIKKASKFIFYISATILDIGLRENIDNGDVYIMNNVPNYMGLNKIKHRKLEIDKCKPSNQQNNIITERDPNIIIFLDKFSKYTPHYNEWFDC